MSRINLPQRKSFIVAAGGVLPLVAPGRKFFVEQATGRFDVEVDDGNRGTVRAGSETPDMDRFERLTIYNTSTNELRGVIWVGAAGMRFAYPQNVPVLLRPSSGTMSLTTDRDDFPGFATGAAAYSDYGIEPGSRRAFFLISHRTSSTTDILLRDANDDVFHAVTGNSQQMIPVDTFFSVSLSAATVVPYTVGEFFYA